MTMQKDLKISRYPKEFWDRHYFNTKSISVGGRVPEESTEWQELRQLLRDYGISTSYEGFYSMIIDILALSKEVFQFARENGFDPLEMRARTVEEIAVKFHEFNKKNGTKTVCMKKEEIIADVLTDLKGKVEKRLIDINK